MSLPIGEVARRSGLSHDALRYDEREGLLRVPERTTGGAQRYDESALDQLRVITALRAVGFFLDHVRTLLAAKSGTSTVRARVEARAALDELDAALDEKERALGEARAQLRSWREERALGEARAQLRSWREELDAGEPWPDTPLSC